MYMFGGLVMSLRIILSERRLKWPSAHRIKQSLVVNVNTKAICEISFFSSPWCFLFLEMHREPACARINYTSESLLNKTERRFIWN